MTTADKNLNRVCTTSDCRHESKKQNTECYACEKRKKFEIIGIFLLCNLRVISLGIVASVVSREDIECISQMHLTNLDLVGSNIDCGALSVIYKSASFRTLWSSRCKFSAPQCIKEISRMKNIETLDLTMCDISSANILYRFINHPSLKTIYIDGTRLTADDMLLFEKKPSGLPQLIGQPLLSVEP
ncbi:MAG: hypothetical protein LBU65_06995 [Planctomycetaceae bacterium]|jgi:hypothetical protein|nr:hypothetical protein [Planctomycetaceae bacterium]